MKKKILIVNNISGISFLISSLSILGIPFIDQNSELPTTAYILAFLFWGGLITGIALQVIASRMANKTQTKKNHKINRLIMIPIILFAIMLLMLLCFWKNSVLLIAIDIALLFSSIELLFYLKRRNSV